MSTATLKPPSTSRFSINRGQSRKAHRTMIYGVGGIGKTSLASKRDGVVFIDLEGGTIDLDVQRVDGLERWTDLRTLLASDTFDGASAICIDTVSRAEELCKQHVVTNVKTEKGATVDNIEAFGFGKGYVHLVDEWRRFIGDLERHYRAGRDILLIAHAHLGKTPNPSGEDYIRHEPRLHHSPNASVRAITVEWCDHVLFVNYDVSANNEGKAKGSGSRAIYAAEQATHIAKSRTLDPTPVVFAKDTSLIWDAMRKGAAPLAPEL